MFVIRDVDAESAFQHFHLLVFRISGYDVVEVVLAFILDDFNGLVVTYCRWVVGLGDAIESVFMFDLRAEASYSDLNVRVFVLSEVAREGEEVEHFFEGDSLDALVFMQAGEPRFLFRLGVAYLSDRAEASHLHVHVLTR